MNPWIKRAIVAYVAPRLMAKGREMWMARQQGAARPMPATRRRTSYR